MVKAKPKVGAQQPSDSDEASREALDREDVNKAQLIGYAYEQVLDATKHQDDKVGRLLTTIAFLTAASLALAGLGGAKAVAALVNLGGDTQSAVVPVAFICLLAFIVGVSLTVIQLLGSLSTPLRLPGLDATMETPKTGRGTPSTIYFHEIEKNTLAEWTGTWTARAEKLRSDRFKSLVGETHNLAKRTSFKYNRTTEAQAVLTWALIALSLTASFVAIATLDESHPLLVQSSAQPAVVTLDIADMLLVGTVLCIVTFVWSAARMRHIQMGRDDLRPEAVRLQLTVVFGSATSIFVAAGLPKVLNDWQPYALQAGIGFFAMFTATSMVWATWQQSGTTRANAGRVRLKWTVGTTVALVATGCAVQEIGEFHDWRRGLAWASGTILGSLLATFWVAFVCDVALKPKHDQSTLPPHEEPAVKCMLCREMRKQDAAGKVKWRVVAILLFAAVLSFATQVFPDHGAYAWPLSAACATLTVLIGVAVLEPTFMENREKAFRKQRAIHAKSSAPTTLTSGPVGDSGDGGTSEQITNVGSQTNRTNNANPATRFSRVQDEFGQRFKAVRRGKD